MAVVCAGGKVEFCRANSVSRYCCSKAVVAVPDDLCVGDQLGFLRGRCLVSLSMGLYLACWVRRARAKFRARKNHTSISYNACIVSYCPIISILHCLVFSTERREHERSTLCTDTSVRVSYVRVWHMHMSQHIQNCIIRNVVLCSTVVGVHNHGSTCVFSNQVVVHTHTHQADKLEKQNDTCIRS